MNQAWLQFVFFPSLAFHERDRGDVIIAHTQVRMQLAALCTCLVRRHVCIYPHANNMCVYKRDVYIYIYIYTVYTHRCIIQYRTHADSICQYSHMVKQLTCKQELSRDPVSSLLERTPPHMVSYINPHLFPLPCHTSPSTSKVLWLL